VEKFSCEGQCQDSLQDTARFAGTKEDALHAAVLVSRTRREKFTRASALHDVVASIADCLQAQESEAKLGD